MTDEEGDRICAEAQGWQAVYIQGAFVGGCRPGASVHDDEFQSIPRPSTDPAAFVALLEFHAREGRTVTIGNAPVPPTDPALRWVVGVDQFDDARSWSDTPLRAIVAATVAWSRSRKDPA